MARRANIVSFADAKNASRNRRAQERFRSARYVEEPTPDPLGLSGNPSYASFLERYSVGMPEDEEELVPEAAEVQPRNTLSEALKNFSDKPAGDEEAEEAFEPQRMSRREKRRRERAKNRADKLFDKQIGQDGIDMPAEGAPRAALYEGKMGSSHRKSARMQRASMAAPQSAKLNPAGWFSRIPLTKRSLKVGTAVLCLLLVGIFLYVPAQQYYQSVRELDRLEAEYAIVSQRNDTLDSQIDSFASNAGMEDAVRQKYGYVIEGDETAIVTGLSENASDPSRNSDNLAANVLSSSVKAPEEWYTPFLDAFFGVA